MLQELSQQTNMNVCEISPQKFPMGVTICVPLLPASDFGAPAGTDVQYLGQLLLIQTKAIC